MTKPKKAAKKTPSKKVAQDTCELCDNTKSDRLVACDKCNKWYHFSCVNIKSIGKKDPWMCPTCTTELANESAQTVIENVSPTVHAPIQPQIDVSAVESRMDCVVCHQVNNNPVITCETCDKQYHIRCVNLEMHRWDQPWKCLECVATIQSFLHVLNGPNVEQQQHQNIQPTQTDGESNQQQSRSRRPIIPIIEPRIDSHINHEIINDNRVPVRTSLTKTATSTIHSGYSRISRRAEIEMEYLEEERILQEKLDRDQERREREREEREREYLRRKYSLLRQECGTSERATSLGRSCYTKSWVNDSYNHRHSDFDNDGDIDSNEFQRRHNELRNVRTSTTVNDTTDVNVKPPPQEQDQKPSKANFTDANQQSNRGETIGAISGTIKPERILTKNQIAARHIMAKKLKDFYGDPLQWTMWFSVYENDTDMCGLSDVENLTRLKDSLKGKALEAVKHRLLTPSAVPQIISTLKMLYGRPELIVNQLLTNIKSIPAPKADKLETLVDYALAVKNISSEIEGAKLHYHLANPTLLHDLVEKLPTNVKMDWAKFKATKGNVTVLTLADWLYSLAEIVCTVTIPNTSDYKSNKSKKQTERINVHQTDPKQSKAVGDSNAIKTKAQSLDQCKICKQKCSETAKCPTFKTYRIDQRWDAIFANGLCRNCLKPHKGVCRLTNRCEVNGCTYKHHPLLHRTRPTKDNVVDTSESTKQSLKSNSEEITTVVNNYHSVPVPNVFYRIIPVILYHHDEAIRTLAYIDEGSTGTLMQEDLAERLNLKGSTEQLCLLWTSNHHRIEKKSKRLDIEISGQCEFSKRYEMKGVRTVEDLGLPLQTIHLDQLSKRYPYLRKTHLIDYTNEQPGILIGLPHAKLCTQLETIEREDYEPIASRSRIGWSLHGPTRDNHENYQEIVNQHRFVVCKNQQDRDDELHNLVKEFFSLENFGVRVNNDLNVCSKDNQRALDILRRQTKRKNGHFETALLWRFDSVKLEDSYQMAKKRLMCLEKSKPNLIKVINDTIADYINKGYVSKLTPKDLSIERSKVGYLPIFTDKYPKKPEKVRMVFDAAAKVNGTSLNSLLLKGPDQLNSLTDILLRFRENPIAISADVIEMFHRIEICDEDKHVQRFLWRNGDTSKEPDEYVLNVMTFGATCSPSSAQFVKNENAKEFEEELPRAVQAITMNTYVDDMMEGESSVEKAVQLVKDVEKIYERGGFQIGKFLSNSPEYKRWE